MDKFRMRLSFIVTFLLLAFCGLTSSQSFGLKSITKQELMQDLEFITASELKGRSTPSEGLEIISKYLGNRAKYVGLKPLLMDSSFYQFIPLNISMVQKPARKSGYPGEVKNAFFIMGKALESIFQPMDLFQGKWFLQELDQTLRIWDRMN